MLHIALVLRWKAKIFGPAHLLLQIKGQDVDQGHIPAYLVIHTSGMTSAPPTLRAGPAPVQEWV